jgi:PAS domain-containing protein
MAGLARFVRWRSDSPAAGVAGEIPTQPSTRSESMAALLGTMEVGILFLSVENEVSYCNPAFLRIWQLPPTEDLTGSGVEALLAVMGSGLARPAERTTFLLHAPPPGEPEVKLDLPMAACWAGCGCSKMSPCNGATPGNWRSLPAATR